jgi:hypothetical protein
MPRIRTRRGTTSQWNSSTTPLLSGELGLDTTLNKLKAGNGTSLWADLPFLTSEGGGSTGDITFDGIQIIGAGTASGDGYGLGTIELVPDGDITSDQYLIIDPTAPNHIHIRAGGQQDNSSAQVYLGGERNNIEVSDPYRTVKINTKPNGTENTYGNSNEASNTQFIHASTADIIVGDTVRLYTGGATYVVTAVTQDSPSAGFITVVADGLSFITGEAYVFTRDQGYNNQWTFGNDAKIYFPNGSIVESPMNEGHLTIYASTSSTLNGGYVEIAGGAANSDNKTGGTVNIIGGGVNGYNGTGGNVVLETVSSGKILLSGNGGEFLNDMSNPDNQIATMSDIADANEYTDTAVAGLGNSIDGQYVPVGDVGNIDGVAPLDGNALIPDSYIPSSIARDSELFSGSYNDLSNKPNIALGAVQWTANHYLLPGGENTRYLAGDIVYDGGNIYVANFDNESLPTTNTQYWSLVGSGKRLNIDGRDVPNITYDQLNGKPTIPDLTGYATETYVGTAISNLIDGAGPALDTLNELAAAINDDASFASTLTTALGNKLDSSTASSTYLTQTDASTTYAPVNSPTFTGTVGGITKSMVGLEDVDNTSDANKPISTATQSALDLKASLTGAVFTGAVVGIDKVMVGLDNVDNTSDANKPVSTATQTELDLKAPLANPAFTGTVTGITKSMVDLANVDNTSDANKPVSTATQTALDFKLNLSDPSVDYYITNSGSGAYIVNGVSNGLIYFEKGKKYRIHVNASGHPFWIQTVSGAYSAGNVYSTGITNGGEDVGHILVELPQSAPDDLYYACQYHSSMQGSISVQSQNTITINSKSSSYTILPVDSGKIIEMSAGGTVTITDSTAFPVGYSVDILQTGSSQVTIAGNGFTPNSTPGLKLRTQWSSATLIKRALNSWVVLGDLSA